MAKGWAVAPMVFIPLPACPECGSSEYIRVRTDDNGDGSSTQKVVCRSCSLRFKIVWEPAEEDSPASGIWPENIL
jgi:hypothetical protein